MLNITDPPLRRMEFIAFEKNAGLQINIIEAANYSVHVILAKIFNLFHSVEMTDMKRNKLVFALPTTRNILNIC